MKIAFCKFAGLAAGGIEKYLQSLALILKEEGHDIDYYYTNSGPIRGTNWIHPPNDKACKNLVTSKGINIIKVDVGYRENNTWYNTNFFELFDENNYDWNNVELLGILQYFNICTLYDNFKDGRYGNFLFLYGKYLLARYINKETNHG